MSVNTELQALLTKMGGTPSESDSNSDLIKKISTAYESGGSNGGSSEESPFFFVHITSTYDDHTNTTVLSLDKTYEEITAAVANGKLAKAVDENGTMLDYVGSRSAGSISFQNVIYSFNTFGICGLSVNSENVVTDESMAILPMPSVDGVSSGSVLTYTQSDGIHWHNEADNTEPLPAS